jgi:hypothetical protein
MVGQSQYVGAGGFGTVISGIFGRIIYHQNWRLEHQLAHFTDHVADRARFVEGRNQDQ